jgi:hypothetical protein
MVSMSAWITLPFIGIATVVSAEEPKNSVVETEKTFYAAIERTIKQEFDDAVAELKRAASTKNLSQKVYDGAFNGIKFTFYNKANFQVTCLGDVLRSPVPGETSADIKARAQSCYDAKAADFMILGKLADYAAALSPGISIQCQIEARLFERELLLPPYEFLKDENGTNTLIDPKALGRCLRRVR